MGGNFVDEIRKISNNSTLVINESPYVIENHKKYCEKYIDKYVEKVKQEIKTHAKNGNVQYIKTVHTGIFGGTKEKNEKPHYHTWIQIGFMVNVHESVCEYKYLSYIDDGWSDPREGFEINSYEIIEYIVKSIIDKLQEENIDLVDGRLGEKYEFSDFKKLELKKFKDLVNTSKKNHKNSYTELIYMHFSFFV